jgi:lysozyme family protein
MRGDFGSALAAVLVHEGGYVNDPQDPGGATNRGVTQKVYDNWRSGRGLPHRSVRDIEDVEIEAIYRKLYWDAVKGDELPSGLDYCLFDFAVNSGPGRAARFLQTAVGVATDGKIGPGTLTAVAAHDAVSVIRAVCAARLDFLQGLSTFARFGRGWTARVNEVRTRAEAMA